MLLIVLPFTQTVLIFAAGGVAMAGADGAASAGVRSVAAEFESLIANFGEE